ncbi:MAG: thioredoxin fold domain-containing protein [Flavobacteriales bacterium]|jgi:thioredoxin 1|nr:thioredoxin fold domain-containing protein [Flavobacteriales bacterium]
MKKILSLLSIVVLISCGETNSQVVQNIKAEKFQEFSTLNDGIIIDVRTAAEFNSGHIKDATNIDFYANDFESKLKIVRKDVPIYVYCRSGGRSSSAAKKMEKLGFSEVYNLLGGIGSWNSKGYKIIKSKSGKQSEQPKFSISEIDEILKKNKTVLIDFSTQWCVPCKKMNPIIEEIQSENSEVKVLFIDADVNKELIKKYQIQGVPVFIIFKNGKEAYRNIGVVSKSDLVKNL